MQRLEGAQLFRQTEEEQAIGRFRHDLQGTRVEHVTHVDGYRYDERWRKYTAMHELIKRMHFLQRLCAKLYRIKPNQPHAMAVPKERELDVMFFQLQKLCCPKAGILIVYFNPFGEFCLGNLAF